MSAFFQKTCHNDVLKYTLHHSPRFTAFHRILNTVKVKSNGLYGPTPISFCSALAHKLHSSAIGLLVSSNFCLCAEHCACCCLCAEHSSSLCSPDSSLPLRLIQNASQLETTRVHVHVSFCFALLCFVLF